MQDPKLQNGQTSPKWNQCAWLGWFISFSNDYSSLVVNVRNLRTNSVSPQFHVVFDGHFQIVFSSGENDMVVNAICNYLIESNQDVFAEDEFSVDGKYEVQLSEPEHQNRREKMQTQCH